MNPLAKKKNGFTVVELMVTIAILAIINTVVFLNYPALRENINLKRTAEEMAVIIKQEQSDALNVRRLDDPNNNNPNYNPFLGIYGVHFNSSNNNTFVLFADNGVNINGNNNNNRYVNTGGNICKNNKPECVQEYQINNGITISNLEVSQDGISYYVCNNNKLNIIFTRAKVLAQITDSNGSSTFGCGPSPSITPSVVKIVLNSPSGKIKTIEVWVNGQVSIK